MEEQNNGQFEEFESKSENGMVQDTQAVPRKTVSRPARYSVGEPLSLQGSDSDTSSIEYYKWVELKHALRTKKILTGVVESVAMTAAGNVAMVRYHDFQIAVPASEMVVLREDILAEIADNQRLLDIAYGRQLNRLLGAEIDFILSGIDPKSDAAVGSRLAAMEKKQQNYYMPEESAAIRPGSLVEARIINVGEKAVRVEIFGVETVISARELAWEWIDDATDYYSTGQHVWVKVMDIDRSEPAHIRIQASIREATENPAYENIKKCVVQGRYIGRVTGIRQNKIFLRLNNGVNAIAIDVASHRMPCVKDDVSFVLT